MKLTMDHVVEELKMHSLHIVAGREGLSHDVEGCGVLDYEYDDKFKDKYMPITFKKHDLVLTSFQYAKDKPYLILDAIKAMIARGCSGVLFYNIYRIPLEQRIIAYADTKNFPIILVNSSHFSFVDTILRIHHKLEQYHSLTYEEMQVDAILSSDTSTSSIVSLAKHINYSLDDDHAVLYFRSKQAMDTSLYLKIEEAYHQSSVMTASDSIFLYKNGFMIIYSCEMFTTSNIREIIDSYIDIIKDQKELFYIGAGNIHHTLKDLAYSLREALYASGMQTYRNEDYTLYEDMGVYQILMPHVDDVYMKEFAASHITALMDYDAQHHTQLLDTAISFIMQGGNLEACAREMMQHVNTLRYRLKQISAMIGGNVLEFQFYEILSMAIKIYICTQAMQVYKESRFPS